MGASMCNSYKQGSPEQDPFSFQYNNDTKQDSVYHKNQLICKNAELRQTLKNYAENLRQSHSFFRDSALKSQNIILKSKDKELRCVFLRPYEFLPKCQKNQPYGLLGRQQLNASDIIVKDQVMQFFGVFLCFLAQNRHLIQKMLVTQENSYGLQVVQVRYRNKKQYVMVDDLILCQHGKPLFAQPLFNQYMWPCILEKAWLKMKGSSMKRIVKSPPEEVFETFFNFPIQRIQLEKQDDSVIIPKIRKNLTNQRKAKAIILTSKAHPKHKIGLSNQDFYYLGTFQADNKQLYYIRNPCQDFNFRGMYALVSDDIKRKLSQQLGVKDIPRGNFILEEKQLIEQISFITIVHCELGEQFEEQTVIFQPDQEFFISFDNKYSGPMCIGLRQNTQVPYFDSQDVFYPLTYHLVNLKNNTIIGGLQNDVACFGVRDSFFLPDVVNDVSPGKYILRLKKKPGKKNIKQSDSSIISYCPSPLKLDYKNQQQLKTKYYEFLLEGAKKQLKNKLNDSNARTYGNPDFEHVIVWLGDVVVLYLKKVNEKKQSVNIEMHFPELMNLQCIYGNLKKGQYLNLQLKDQSIFVLQKINLMQETKIKKYTIQSY